MHAIDWCSYRWFGADLAERANGAWQHEEVEGYTASSYGDRFADVYDDWYGDVSPAEATASFVAQRCSGLILELGSGTGRLLAPLVAQGRAVIGLDASRSMLARSTIAVPGAPVSVGDMTAPPFQDGAFGGIFVAYNTLFNVATVDGQAAVFAAASRLLAPEGCLIVEVFVPVDGEGRDDRVEVTRLEADRVTLRVSRTDFPAQTVSGQYVDLIHGEPVTLRPWHLRFAAPGEIDALAAAAGLTCVDRAGGWDGEPFEATSAVRVSVYRRQ